MRMGDRLLTIEAKLGAHGETLASIQSDIRNMKENVDKLAITILGNGKEGLCTTVTKHDTTIRNIKYVVTTCITIISVVIAFLVFFK